MDPEPHNRDAVLSPMSNLTKLPLKTKDGLLRAVVETPKGSTQKIDYDAELECFWVKRRLPIGIAYPFHFGFFPSTKGGDGDPLDAIVLSAEPAFSGLVLSCRIVGVLKLSQREDGKSFRNDRFIAIPKSDVAYAHISDARAIGSGIRKEIEQFLVASVKLEDKTLKFLGWAGAAQARELIGAGKNA